VTLQLEDAVTKEALDQMGLDPESPYSQARQQHDINRLLSHFAEVLKGLYEAYKMDGPEEVYLRVTGNPQPVEFIKDPDEAEMNVSVTFNTLYDDPEQMKELRETILQASQMDTSGRVNAEAGVDMFLNMADPVLADVMLLPTEQGQDKIVKEVKSDITSMAAGMEEAPAQNASQLRLEVFNEYINSPTGLAKIQGDPVFQMLMLEYEKKLQFNVDQFVKNPQIGRIGGDPATMGNINTQDI
jgi:hypothetical protein